MVGSPEVPKRLDVRLAGKDIQELIEEVEKQKIVLPDFQRDFVWPTYEVQKLLESILNGYYINTLLTLPVVGRGEDNLPFPPRSVKGSPSPTNDPFNIEMVLDGQQRITSVYYALTMPDFPLANTKYPQLFCLRFSKAVKGELDEEAIVWRRADWGASKELMDNDFQVQLEKDLIPFTIFKSKQSFKRWRRGMEDFARNHEDMIDKEKIDSFDDNTEVFRNYSIPIITMSSDTSPTTVVQTFERINTQGLELGVFDILTARLYTSGIKLRDLWKESVNQYPRIERYSENNKKKARERILKTLALFRGRECKDRQLRNLNPKDFEAEWFQATEIMDRALEKAKSADAGGYGVTEKFGFPYSAILPVLANLIYQAEQGGTYPSQDGLEKIHRWYWSSVFSKRYSGSSDTTAYKDYNEVKDWIKGKRSNLPEAVENGRKLIPIELNLDTLDRGGPYKGVMSLLVLNGAKDFGTFESITIHRVDDHHIFPTSRLRSGINGNRYNETARNRILNRTIIESRGNRYRYQNELPSEYIPKMVQEHPDGEQGVRKLLKDHFINDKAFTALLADDYEAFCAARKEKIREAIKERIKMDIDWSISEREIE